MSPYRDLDDGDGANGCCSDNVAGRVACYPGTNCPIPLPECPDIACIGSECGEGVCVVLRAVDFDVEVRCDTDSSYIPGDSCSVSGNGDFEPADIDIARVATFEITYIGSNPKPSCVVCKLKSEGYTRLEFGPLDTVSGLVTDGLGGEGVLIVEPFTYDYTYTAQLTIDLPLDNGFGTFEVPYKIKLKTNNNDALGNWIYFYKLELEVI